MVFSRIRRSSKQNKSSPPSWTDNLQLSDAFMTTVCVLSALLFVLLCIRQKHQRSKTSHLVKAPRAALPASAASIMRAGPGRQWSDAELERWWRFAYCDATEASTLLERHLHWRASRGLMLKPPAPVPWRMRDWPADVLTLRKACAYRFHKTGRSGHPVLYHRLGLHDKTLFGSLCTSVNTKRAVQAFLHEVECSLWERLPACSAARGHDISGLIYILDMRYFSLALIDSAVMAYVAEVGWALEAQYPRLLHRCLVVNTSSAVAVLWNMVSSLLSSSTRRRIEFCRAGEQTRTRLHELIAPTDLPQDLGGTDASWWPAREQLRAQTAWWPEPGGRGSYIRCASMQGPSDDDGARGPYAIDPRLENGPWAMDERK